MATIPISPAHCIKRRYGASPMIEEAHALGMMGKTGQWNSRALRAFPARG